MQTARLDEVTVSCYGGKKAHVLVAKDWGGVVEVCTQEELDAAHAEGREPLTVGFRREDVIEGGSSSRRT